MTRLKDRLVDLIEALGPLPVNEYMAHCLFDPRDGYYTTREPFGRDGDFITAPEISQMFGELVGVWIIGAWQALGSPLDATIAEIGPGRATLMKDVHRTLSRLAPPLVSNGCFALVESSPRLTGIQKKTLANLNGRFEWHTELATLPPQPLILIGNELLDAIPIRQFVRVGADWRERAVGLDGDDHLRFVAGAGSVDPALLPSGAIGAPDGTIAELAPARSALVEEVVDRLARDHGAALFFDYGHLESGFGDTLQAVRRHAKEDVFENPGEADLTSHVDFAALAHIARLRRLDVHLCTQQKFLLELGLLERAGSLGATADHATRERLTGEVQRLAGADAMGELFKVMAILPKGVVTPPFGAAG